ncbi:MAG TPA: CaiB/BaiF CoA-transferase family protein [Candidatus Dormibacteraeota bacterium]|nr:CaiB/BaiF CoA-transferase family protein [Candidatus Dormibacteraeota bacterium]
MNADDRAPYAPLSGLRVVAIEQAVAAPLCTRHLGDLGADVIKVEQPGTGDFARQFDSVVKGQSTHFVWLNRGKRSIALDLRSPDGARTINALLDRADVFVHNLGPGAIDRLGLGWDSLQGRRPGLIHCSIGGYATEGPYRDRKSFDALVQGESGVMSVTGTEAQIAKVGLSVADISGAMYALAAVLAALHERERTGRGKRIEISMLDCMAEWMMPFVYQQVYTGLAPRRAGARHAMIVPYGPFRASDGVLVNLAVQNAGQWERLCENVIDRPDLLRAARFATNELRVRHRDELEPIIEQVVSTMTSGEIEARLAQFDVPYGRVNSVEGLSKHPQLAGRWFEVASVGGPVLALAHPFAGPSRQARRPVPALGEHTEEILAELGFGDSQNAVARPPA